MFAQSFIKKKTKNKLFYPEFINNFVKIFHHKQQECIRQKMTFLLQETFFCQILSKSNILHSIIYIKALFFLKKVWFFFVFNNYCYYFCARNKQKERIMYNSLYILNNLNLVVLRR